MSKLKAICARSRIPRYIQVAAVLRQRIENGRWRPGQQISALERLERVLEVARVTARQAVALLQNEGQSHRQQGRGTFVAEVIYRNDRVKLPVNLRDGSASRVKAARRN